MRRVGLSEVQTDVDEKEIKIKASRKRSQRERESGADDREAIIDNYNHITLICTLQW